MNVILTENIADVSPEEWDALADGSFYAGYGWAEYQQLDPNSTTFYFLVRDQGVLVAAVSTYLVTRDGNNRYRPSALFPDLEPVQGQPVLLVGNRRGHANRLLVDHSHPQAGLAIELLVEAVNQLAAEVASGRAWWLYLGENDVVRLNAYSVLSKPRLLAADCAITLPGDCFEDYLAAASKNQRRQIRRDRRMFREAGYECGEEDFRELWGQMGPLIASHQTRHGHEASPQAMTTLMRQQAATCGRAATVHACYQGPDIAGCALTFTTGTHVAARAYGFDYRRKPVAAEYFELFYYRPIEAAYAARVRELHLGIGSLQPKARRGARVLLLWGLVTGRPVKTDDDEGAALNRARWRQITEQLSDHPDALAYSALSTALF